MKRARPRRKISLQRELQRVFKILIREYNPQKIILFGSLAKNLTHESSDIDLLIIKESAKRYLERVDEVIHLIHPRVGMDVFVLTPNEVRQVLNDDDPYLEEILMRGRVLYEKAS